MKPPADIESVKSIVVEAGRRALERCGTVQCEYKADQSLVTAVDKDTEEFVRAELQRLYPDHAFIGEEFGLFGDPDAPLWGCDPIDGTTNFVFGLPHWCVSVGLIYEGEPVLGAVYLPRMEELFWGVRGEGSYCNGVRLQAADRDSMHVEDTICLTSNSSKTLNTEAIPGRIRCLGSIATELIYTARGNLCATVGLREGITDMAAALCICREAGCELAMLSGPPIHVPDLVRARHTSDHFVCAPRRFVAYLQSILRRRNHEYMKG